LLDLSIEANTCTVAPLNMTVIQLGTTAHVISG